jgi:hypothetical protein
MLKRENFARFSFFAKTLDKRKKWWYNVEKHRILEQKWKKS